YVLLFDVDEHIGLDECIRAARLDKIDAFVSNPCFEIWLLWHCEDYSKYATAHDLRQRLLQHGVAGKTLPATFPVRNFPRAVERATAIAPGHTTTAVRKNPSSDMGWFIMDLRGNRYHRRDRK